MATTPKTKIGHTACPSCGEKMPVKQSPNGTLNLSCPECDYVAYAKQGTDAHRHAMKKITMLAVPATPAAPAPKAAPKAAPAAPTMAAAPVTKKNTIFG